MEITTRSSREMRFQPRQTCQMTNNQRKCRRQRNHCDIKLCDFLKFLHGPTKVNVNVIRNQNTKPFVFLFTIVGAFLFLMKTLHAFILRRYLTPPSTWFLHSFSFRFAMAFHSYSILPRCGPQCRLVLRDVLYFFFSFISCCTFHSAIVAKGSMPSSSFLFSVVSISENTIKHIFTLIKCLKFGYLLYNQNTFSALRGVCIWCT